MRIFLVLFAFFLYSSASCQQYYFRHYTSKDGLPSSRTYNCISGNDGRLWITTENGIATFDGYKFKRYAQQEGLTDYGAFTSIKTKDNKIWFVPFNGRLVYYYNQAFHEVKAPSGLELLNVSWIVEDSNSMLITTRSGGIHRYDFSTQTTKKIHQSIAALPIAPITVLNHRYIIYSLNKSPKGIEILDTKNGSTFQLAINNIPEKCKIVRFLNLANGKTLITCSEGIFEIDASLKLRKLCNFSSPYFDQEIVALFQDINKDIWLSNSHGLAVFNKGVIKPIPDKILVSKQMITHIHKDFEGGYWATSTAGIFYFRNPINSTINANSGLSSDGIAGISNDKNGNLWVLLENGDLGLLKGEQFTKIKSLNTLNNFELSFMHKSQEGDIICEWPTKKYIIKNKIISPLDRHKTWSVKDTNGRTWTFDPQNATVCIGNKTIQLFGYQYSMRPQCFDSSGNLWLSSKIGAWYISPQCKLINAGIKQNNMDVHVVNILLLSENRVVCFTKNNGIILLKRTGTKISQIASLPLPVINNIFKQSQSSFWIATSQGLFNIIINQKNQIAVNKTYTSADFLPSNDVQSILVKNNIIYAGTKSGLAISEYRKTSTIIPPPFVSINYLQTDTFIHDNTTPIRLDYNNNNIKIDFTGISFRSEGSMEYRYKLEPINKNWTSTKSTSINFYQLPPGNYTFTVLAKNSFNRWSKEPANIQFEIIPAYWQTLSFKLIIILVLLTIINALVFYRIKSIRKKILLEKQIIASNLKALQAQMNPHFIFNSLNSIQDFILDRKPEEANYYLTQFATLMRMIIDYSSKESISIQLEIDFLCLYMELEKLRFSDGIQFDLQSDIKESDYIKISPMMIQPLLENSIKHGLNQKEKNASIQINITQQKDLIRFEIIDNGKGMDIENMTKSKHQSIGLRNITERIELLGKKEKGGLSIENHYTTEGTPSGTKVVLYLPILNYSND